MRSLKSLSIMIVTLAAIILPTQARADTPAQTVVSPPGGWLSPIPTTGPVAVTYGYAPTVIAVTQSGLLTYTNLDAQAHNFISVATTTDPSNWDPRYCESLKPANWQSGDPLPPCALFQDRVLLPDGSPDPDADDLGSRGITQSAPVLLQMPDGTPKLQPNTPYIFYCSFHAGMKGTLIAIPG